MTKVPMDVARFHADYDRHPDDRIRLFEAIAAFIDPDSVLYAGSYVDIAPSAFFADVVYVDTDRRAARFFAERAAVEDLIRSKRAALGRTEAPLHVTFHHQDYREHLPLGDGSVGLVVSLYAGFVSEHCLRYLRRGGHLLVNPSHGDASLASLDPQLRLVAVVTSDQDGYRIDTTDLDQHLIPKRGHPPTAEELHQLGKGVAYTQSPFAYLFERRDVLETSPAG